MGPVVELDPVGPWDPEESERGGRRSRAAGLTWLVVCLLFLLIGPPPAGASLRLAWRADAYRGYFWLTDDAVFRVVRAEGELRLVADDLATGAPRWERALDGPLAATYHRAAPILAPRFPPTPGGPTMTRVLDAETGRRLGTYPVPAVPLAFFTDQVAVTIDREPGAPAIPPASSDWFYDGWLAAHVVTAIDLGTGATRWVRRLEPGRTWVLPGLRPYQDGVFGGGAAESWMAVLDPAGAVDIWDLATGQVRVHGDAGPFDAWSYALALSDVLAVSTQDGLDAVLTGYDPRTLARLWRMPLPDVPDASAWPVACGSTVCLSSPYALWSLDLTTGALAWHRRVVDVYPTADPLVPVLVIEGPMLVEVRTGRVWSLPTRWRIVDPQPRRGSMVVMRVEDDYHVRLGRLDLTTGGITTLGDARVTSPGGPCRATATHLACADGSTVRVWRIAT
jgi:hypothetical protein